MERLNGHGLLIKPRVAIALLKNQDGVVLLRIQVRSSLRPKSLMSGDLDSREFKSQDDVREKVKILAGSLAEIVRERFGGALVNPDECAREAVRMWDELLTRPIAKNIQI